MSSSSAVFPTAAGAVTLVAALQGSQAQSCVGAQVRTAAALAALKQSVSFSVQTVGRRSVASLGADEELGYEVVLQASQSGVSETEFVDSTVVRVGRVDVAFTQIQTLSPPAGDLAEAFQAAVVRSQEKQGLPSPTTTLP